MTAVGSRSGVREEARARLLAAIAGLPLTISGGSYYQSYFIVAANEGRHLSISEELVLACLIPRAGGEALTLRDVLSAFARGEDKIVYHTPSGHEMTLVLWSPEQEQWI